MYLNRYIVPTYYCTFATPSWCSLSGGRTRAGRPAAARGSFVIISCKHELRAAVQCKITVVHTSFILNSPFPVAAAPALSAQSSSARKGSVLSPRPYICIVVALQAKQWLRSLWFVSSPRLQPSAAQRSVAARDWRAVTQPVAGNQPAGAVQSTGIPMRNSFLQINFRPRDLPRVRVSQTFT